MVWTALMICLLGMAGCGAPAMDQDVSTQPTGREEITPAQRSQALAQQYVKNGDYEQAEIQYKKGLAMDPASVGMMRGLADVYMKLAGRKKESIKAMGGSPDTSQVIQAYYDKAVAVYDEALEFAPGNTDIMEGRAYTLTAATRYEEAVAEYQRVLAKKPDDASVHVNKAYALGKMGEVDSAVQAYSRAVELDPNDRDTILRIARLLYDNNREPESRAWFGRAYMMDTSDNTLGRFLGALYIRAKDYESAVPIYEELVGGESEDWRLQLNYAVALEKTDDPDEALLVYEEVIRLNPEKVEVYFQVADLLVDGERYSEGLEYADRGLVVNPDIANGYASKGKALEKLGTHLAKAKKFKDAEARYTEARTVFQKGLAINDPRFNDYFKKQIARQEQLIDRNEAQADMHEYGYE
ncbi:MAG: tetratricopeptide repeat protein [Candidatus Eisenbacteria sp.]|nr:tetratricopeptide repeat protein [Candidatus Eisenbacteria bacterium]